MRMAVVVHTPSQRLFCFCFCFFLTSVQLLTGSGVLLKVIGTNVFVFPVVKET